MKISRTPNSLQPFSPSRGFTLIELIIVLVIITIIAVVVYPKWQGTSINLLAQTHLLANDLRYTQSLSIATNQHYYLNVTSTTSYQIKSPSGSPVTLANGGTSVILQRDITFGTFTNCPNNLIMFDGAGVPYTSTSGTALTNTATLPLVTSSGTHAVLVWPTTGAITVQ